MRKIRNVALVLFAVVASVAAFPSAVGAHECLDVSGIEVCVSCGRPWYGTCYTASSNCDQFGCNGPWGPEANCAGGDIYLCQCPSCS